MLTNNEITALNLSPTKKDFVQIWNELLEVAGKLSERWDPTSTNESDPGIVLLKAITGIADKLNYNIDKNTLEAFMPTAAQEDSMRKLCDMLGYNIKYFQSATTAVNIRYHNTEPSEEEKTALENSIRIPKFTVITNVDRTVNYFTVNKDTLLLSTENPSISVDCMEGQIVKCESINENGLITANQITEDNRFYLPETQIAENGIFVYSTTVIEQEGGSYTADHTRWEKVDNLNTTAKQTLAYKFGFDSYEGRPYIEFPSDYSELFGSGLFIYYARTSGANGNISPRTLTTLEAPNLEEWDQVSIDSFSVENISAATTGANPETIAQAYKNFKKTIGTFNTLVTCRDYMNKIYSMVDNDNKPYVSNILVTDIRNDLNRAVTICTADDSGIFYKETPIIKPAQEPETKTVTKAIDTTIKHTALIQATKPVFDNGKWHVGDASAPDIAKTKLIEEVIEGTAEFEPANDGTVMADSESGRWTIKQGNTIFKTTLVAFEEIDVPVTTTVSHEFTNAVDKPEIDHFDLILYPFKSYNQIRSNVKDIRAVYDASFNYTASSFNKLQARLMNNDLSTIAHSFKKPRQGDVLSINNYLRLNALISTNTKLTAEEGTFIVEKIKIDLANAFNMRELDFGEEIPFEDILAIIEAADSRIRIVSLSDPALYTTYSVLEDYDSAGNAIIREYAVASDRWLTEDMAFATKRFRDPNKAHSFDTALEYFNTTKAREIYNKLAVRNILAGRVPLFNYNDTFTVDYNEAPYTCTEVVTDLPEGMPLPTETDKITLFNADTKTHNGVYTGLWQGAGVDPIFLRTYEPYPSLQNSQDSPYQEVSTFCEIATQSGIATDVELADGEFVKFRAPNFITDVTYPAYVNYHLHLNEAIHNKAKHAEGRALFTAINEDWTSYNAERPDVNPIMWQKVHKYFNAIDYAMYGDRITEEDVRTGVYDENDVKEDNNRRLVKRFKLKQRFSDADTKKAQDAEGAGVILIDLTEKSSTGGEETKSPETYLAESGCVRLLNEFYSATNGAGDPVQGFKVNVYWDDPNKQGDVLSQPLLLPVMDTEENHFNAFIVDSDVFQNIQTNINTELTAIKDKLPATGAWWIELSFECVPFSVPSLPHWESFVLGQMPELDEPAHIATYPTIQYPELKDFFEAQRDVRENAFWRQHGSGYAEGKYISLEGAKYLPIEADIISSLPEDRLKNIFVLKNLGKDADPAVILNDEEYQLRADERLYFEYTPSTQNADGTSETLPPVTITYGPGTIIRPNGFEPGLLDSEFLKNTGKSYTKENVSFKVDSNSGAEIVKLHSLGANEQIEIRKFARTELKNDTLKLLYMYKNFDCPILEDNKYNVNGFRSYTLKDGEYIFYTDDDKAELAFFTSGTKVELHGSVVIPNFDKIEIATILETGIDAVPWRYVPLTNSDDYIIFQEYQYITLGSKDKLGRVSLMGSFDGENSPKITSEWMPCGQDSTYYLASDPTTEVPLPEVRLADSVGGGWEVCSVLELDASPLNAQALRTTGKITTGVRLLARAGLDPVDTDPLITPFANDLVEDSDYPLSFKTNLTCHANSTKVAMDDIYSNPKEYAGFQVKVFTKKAPSIVTTARGKVMPYVAPGTAGSPTIPANFDFATWVEDELQPKANNELWMSANLEDIQAWNTSNDFDKALKLHANILPDTYGLLCIYVSHTSNASKENSYVWFEQLPGADKYAPYIDAPAEHMKDTFESMNYDGIETVSADVYATSITPIKRGLVSTRYLLRPGLNCLRINKSSTFFIKATKEAQGVLFFDDLRLVNIKKPTLASATTTTKGLNLHQLGYLPTISEATLTEETEAAIGIEVDNAFATAEKQFIISANRLMADKLGVTQKQISQFVSTSEKIEELLQDVPANVQTQLNKLTSEDSRDDLFTARTTIKDSISKGEALLEKINSAVNAKELADEVIQAQKDSFFILTEAETEELQKSLSNEYQRLANAELSQDSDKLTLAVLEKLVTHRVLPADTITELENLAKAADTAARQTKLAEIINEISTPLEHENYKSILAAIADLNGLFAFGNNSALALKVSQSEQYITGDLINKLRSILEQLRARIYSMVTITESNGTITESFPSTDLETAYNKISAYIQQIDAKTFTKITGFFEPLTGTNANTFVNDLLTATTGGMFDALAGKESAFTEKELNRVNNLLASFSDIANPDEGEYYLSVTEPVLAYLNTIKAAIPSGVIAIPSNLILTAFGASLKTADSNTIKATAALCKQLSTALPSATQARYEYACEQISAFKTLLSQRATVPELKTGLEAIIGNVISVSGDVTGSPGDLFEIILDTVWQNLVALYKQCTMVATTYNKLSEILSDISDSVGSYGGLQTALTAISVADSDPLSNLVSNLSTELGKDNVDRAIVDFLIKQLRKLVNSEQTVLDYIDSRLTAAVAEATKDIKELNSNSAVIARLNKAILSGILPGSTAFTGCLATIKSEEQTLRTLFSPLLSEKNLLQYADGLQSILNGYTSLRTAAAEDTTTVYPVSCWACLPEIVSELTRLNQVVGLYNRIKTKLDNASRTSTGVSDLRKELETERLTLLASTDALNRKFSQEMLPAMYAFENAIQEIEVELHTLPTQLSELEYIRQAELQLLADIRKYDPYHEFYYSVQVEDSLAIDFNESDDELNTLMNPAMNYSINNVNNNFVISKLDIDYLTKGIQLARSSRLS